MERMRAVSIAAIHGWCVGGGMVLAAACDLRVASDHARFSIPEVDLGLPLAWGGVPRLVREIGPARAKELIMTCRAFDAAEAAAIGFVNRVVPAADLVEEVDAPARSLAAKRMQRRLSAQTRIANPRRQFALGNGVALASNRADDAVGTDAPYPLGAIGDVDRPVPDEEARRISQLRHAISGSKLGL